jgi:hypothetical protein
MPVVPDLIAVWTPKSAPQWSRSLGQNSYMFAKARVENLSIPKNFSSFAITARNTNWTTTSFAC